MGAQTKSSKPFHPKPQYYAVIFPVLQKIARAMGYNLVLHGSMNRDLDLVCIPWIDNPKPELKVVQAMAKYLGMEYLSECTTPKHFLHTRLPGGRNSYVINLYRGDHKHDPQYYLDISFTPLKIS